MSQFKVKPSYTWSANIAYLTGLFASDGCLYNDFRHLNMTSTDAEIINNVQSVLEMNVKVGIKIGSYAGTSAFNLQFGNVAFYDFLVLAGLTPAKSKTIGPINVPDIFYADFLRGYFDGDGTVWGYWDTRWRSSLMYYTGFISASPIFLEWLQRMNQQLVGTTKGAIKPNSGASTLSYAKADSQKLFAAMYHEPNLPILTRKYAKYVAFFRADPYANKELLARVPESVDGPA